MPDINSENVNSSSVNSNTLNVKNINIPKEFIDSFSDSIQPEDTSKNTDKVLNPQGESAFYASQIDYNEKFKDIKNQKTEFNEPMVDNTIEIKEILTDIKSFIESSLVKKSQSKEAKEKSISETKSEPQLDAFEIQKQRELEAKQQIEPLLSMNFHLQALAGYFLAGKSFKDDIADALSNLKQKKVEVDVDSDSGGANPLLGKGLGLGGALRSIGMGFKYWGKNAVDILKGVLVFSASMLIIGGAVIILGHMIDKFGAEVSLGKLATFGAVLLSMGMTMWALSKIMSKVSPADMIKGSLAMAILGAGLIPMVFALGMLKNVEFDLNKLAMLGLTIAGLTAIVTGMGLVAPLLLPGSLAFGVLAGTVLLMATAIGAVMKTNFDEAKIIAFGNSINSLSKVISETKGIDPIKAGGIILLASAISALTEAFAKVTKLGNVDPEKYGNIGKAGLELSKSFKDMNFGFGIDGKVKSITALVGAVNMMANMKRVDPAKFSDLNISIKAFLDSFNSMPDLNILNSKAFEALASGVKMLADSTVNLPKTSTAMDALSKVLKDKFAPAMDSLAKQKVKDIFKSMADGVNELSKRNNELKGLQEGFSSLSTGLNTLGNINLTALQKVFSGSAMSNIIELGKAGEGFKKAGSGIKDLVKELSNKDFINNLSKLEGLDLTKLGNALTAINKSQFGDTGNIGDIWKKILTALTQDGIVIRAMPNAGGGVSIINNSDLGNIRQQGKDLGLTSTQRN